ncbi:MAG TPA: hypothetical protein ENI96_03240 [Sedimenticola thiotaurini]|uniref:Uncharacterized protein n=1 Tax=Sedimenticola thiotaurini TaxID=1543721 RepID=A0A831W4B7_9GAMM|nr:hypothetical protein [Sedimenticola thiotaurini]
MKIKPFFLILLVLIAGILYIYLESDTRPKKGMTATPRQYIEMVEKDKARRLQAERGKQEPAQSR